MSEFQYVGFRAIDGPVREKELSFMRRQSSRAEITPWSFDNEYHYGDFGGDELEMLRRGYDMHLHYANFGIRRLLIRLPHGLPDREAVKPYLEGESLLFVKDKRGPGGILCVQPYHEPGDLEELWDLPALLQRLLPLRGELLNGDLRPLYLAHLAVARDGEHDPEATMEGPVPAGLNQLTDAQRALAFLYSLDEHLLAAAAEKSPTIPAAQDARQQFVPWLERQPSATKDGWLAQLMADPHAGVRREILAAFQANSGMASWPTVRTERTIAQLEALAQTRQHQAARQATQKAARDRAKRLARRRNNPAATLRETERLVAQRSIDAYREIATLLAELREALAGTERADLADIQARTLKRQHPTLRMLVSELRKHGFLQS